VRRRFPGFLLPDEHRAVFEPRAGILMPETALRTLHMLARGYGARLLPHTEVKDWSVRGDGDVVMQTSGGELRARHVVLAPGAWLNRLLAAEQSPEPAPPRLPLTVERQASFWFEPAPGVHVFRPDACPIAIWEHDAGRFIYTFPDMGHGVKAGIHHDGPAVDPDAVDREVGMDEEARMRRLLEAFMPGSAHRSLHAEVCLYTNTPDGHFVIGAHPSHEQVTLVSACSGHGFKFALVIGEAVADLLLEGGSGFDLSPFAVGRAALS
jgi:sarcosine oxidase